MDELTQNKLLVELVKKINMETRITYDYIYGIASII